MNRDRKDNIIRIREPCWLRSLLVTRRGHSLPLYQKGMALFGANRSWEDRRWGQVGNWAALQPLFNSRICFTGNKNLGWWIVQRAGFIGILAGGLLAAAAPSYAAQTELFRADLVTLGPSSSQIETPDPKRGFFVGLHSGLIAFSGIAPIAAGLQVPDSADLTTRSVTASGYYVYTTDWSLATFIGGSFGAYGRNTELFPEAGTARTEFALQGAAGFTYQFSPMMALGLEVRHVTTTDPLLYGSSPLLTPRDKEKSDSVTLRFDYLF